MDLKTINIQVDNRVMKTEFTQEMLIEIGKLKPLDFVDEDEILRKIRLKERKRKIEKIKNNIRH